MLTKQPDYTISELGYPQWQQQLCEDRLYKKCRPPPPRTSYGHSSSHCSSSNSSPSSTSSSNLNRLLPLRETLDDYYKRLLLSEHRARVENCNASRCRDSDDFVAQQKRHKNQWNVQQQRANNNHRRNQNSRDKAQAITEATTTTPTTTTATMKATLVTCDLNSF
ncbi:uncharacterized protein LOC117780063 isoform X2 [Drosophila innubila]|uniref:uncharacterized protein LOC117780063 isoform X2 n=1 Tax=Drosophila innubila TaxID=198719 RepID=UPI00148E26BE|nr:uncharacterized protein LOC117780063 isoform X2 [Drosophila innubila]